MSLPIITPQQMYAAEQRVFDAGTASFDVMRIAGEGVADHLHDSFPDGDVRVLCGPGGNGGDGFVAAARLRDLGRAVRVYSMKPVDALSGDPARAAALWGGAVGTLDEGLSGTASVTLDALFGGGLSRPLSGVAAALSRQGGPTVSVDVPSGLDGLSARPLGPCFRADLTVTFAALRPAHVLIPGRSLCGSVRVQAIGVPVDESVRTNGPDIWSGAGDKAGDSLAVRLLDGDGFRRDFKEIDRGAPNPIEAVRQAAAEAGSVLLVLGEDIVIAAPEGRCAVQPGIARTWTLDDVMAAVRKARAQGLPGFEAACAAVWQASRPDGVEHKTG